MAPSAGRAVAVEFWRELKLPGRGAEAPALRLCWTKAIGAAEILVPFGPAVNAGALLFA
jgi:hypothetical protein